MTEPAWAEAIARDLFEEAPCPGSAQHTRAPEPPVVTAEDVRAIALSLPRAYEALVRDQVKFRVRRIVFAALSPDETVLGFGFPREERPR